MSQLFNNTQDYSPKIINEAAQALNVEPYELLMRPEKAMRLRKYLASAEEVVRLVHEGEVENLKTGTND